MHAERDILTGSTTIAEPPPISEFENPGRPPEFSLAQNLAFDTGLDVLVFSFSMKR
jgi:hypothetical protein